MSGTRYLPKNQAVVDLAALSCGSGCIDNEPAAARQWHLIDEEDWASSWKNTGNPREIGTLLTQQWIPPENQTV